MENEGRKGDLGSSLMEVMLKGNVVVKEETEVECDGDEESGEIGKVLLLLLLISWPLYYGLSLDLNYPLFFYKKNKRILVNSF